MNLFVVKATVPLDELELRKYGKVIGYPILENNYRYLLIAESPQVLDSVLKLPGVISISEENTDGNLPYQIGYQIGNLLYAITTVLGIVEVEGVANKDPVMGKVKDVLMNMLQYGFVQNTEENNLYFNRGLHVSKQTLDDKVS